MKQARNMKTGGAALTVSPGTGGTAAKASSRQATSVGSAALKFRDAAQSWFYHDQSQNVQGPFTRAQMRQWTAQSLLPLSIEVRKAKAMTTSNPFPNFSAASIAHAFHGDDASDVQSAVSALADLMA